MLRPKSKSCLVLDLDETLVHFFGSEKDWDIGKDYNVKEVRTRILDIVADGEFMWGIVRPYTKEFLITAQNVFDIVGIWSAGVESYVQEIAKALFPNKKPYFVWSREKCVTTMTDLESIRQKPLAKLFSAYPEIDPNRTIILDDRSEVCLQDTLSHIDMPIWDATLSDLDREDSTLKCISDWMFDIIPQSKNFKYEITKGIFCPTNKLQQKVKNYRMKSGYKTDSSKTKTNLKTKRRINSSKTKYDYKFKSF